MIPPARVLLYVAAAPFLVGGEFQFEYFSVFGPADVSVHLSIVGRTATLVREPALAEAEGDTIGVFRSEVAPDFAQRLEKLLPDRLKKQTPVVPDSPYLMFKMKTARRDVNLVVPRLPEALAEVKQVLSAMEKLQAAVLAKPYRTLRLELVPPGGQPRAGAPFPVVVRLVNAGVKPVRLEGESPVWIEATPPPPPVTDPNITPLPVSWERLQSQPAAKGPVLVAPGGSASVRLPVVFAAPGRLLLRAKFERRGKSNVEGDQIHGAAISKALPVSVSAR